MSDNECPTLPPPVATDSPAFIFGVVFLPLMLLGCTAVMIKFGLANNKEHLGKGGGGSRCPRAVLCWRLAMVIYGLVVVGFAFSGPDYCNYKWLTIGYFTIWNWFLVVIYFMVGLGTSICDIRDRPSHRLHLAQQFIGEVEVPTAILVTAVLWGVLAPAAGWHPLLFSFDQVSMHIVNAVGMTADFFMSSYTFNPRHAVLPVAWGTLYLLFAIMLNAGTGFYAYFFLDTSTVGYIGWVFFLLAVITILYYIMFGIGLLKKKDRIFASCLEKNSDENPKADGSVNSDVELQITHNASEEATEFENEQRTCTEP